ncbi:S-layer homology domain-containing protein [Paenibacillus ferrarius]|uniref:S-layer homology domain-containing protein n=1 Tax=Paenibacillus ferrarius TaxID=1469647 RepID=UPI003D269094
MKKILTTMLPSLLLALQLASAASASSTVQVQADSSSKQIVIEGTSDANQQVTVFVANPDGGIDYLDQIQADSTGHYQFSYKSRGGYGQYSVSVGGTGTNTPVKTNFLLSDATPTTPSTPTPNDDKPTSSFPPSNSDNVIITREKGSNGIEVAKVSVPAKALADGLSKAKELANGGQPIFKIEVKDAGSVKVELPAASIFDAGKTVPNGIISIQGKYAAYELPVSAIDVSKIAQSLGVGLKDMKLMVRIDPVSDAAITTIQGSASHNSTKLLTSPVEFSLIVEAGGKQQEITSFNSFVSRSLELPTAPNLSLTTGVWFDPDTGDAKFVPTELKTFDGKYQAIIKRKGNSAYGVIEYSKTFGDITGHWAQKDIELMASKLVLKGVTDETFAPENRVTRAEFATLLVRALGLADNPKAAAFSDVNGGDWYAGYIGAAVEAGLVSGFDNHTFHPNENITREQMATMVASAIRVAGVSVDVVGKQDTLLATFKDRGAISGWAASSIAQSVKAGVIQGMADREFMPSDTASRAQAAVMLKRMLQYVNFLNE